VPGARYLADTSVFARLTKPAVSSAFAPYAAAGQVVLCAAVAFEIGYAARSPSDYRDVAQLLLTFPHVPITDADHRRALQTQAALAGRSQHRALSLVGALVAAVAEARDLVILHYDVHFELVAAVTGQPHEWVVGRGTVD
jgi:predicted nucleic acid-binding protein